MSRGASLESLFLGTFCRWRDSRKDRGALLSGQPGTWLSDSFLQGTAPCPALLPAQPGALNVLAYGQSCFRVIVPTFSVLFCLGFRQMELLGATSLPTLCNDFIFASPSRPSFWGLVYPSPTLKPLLACLLSRSRRERGPSR